MPRRSPAFKAWAGSTRGGRNSSRFRFIHRKGPSSLGLRRYSFWHSVSIMREALIRQFPHTNDGVWRPKVHFIPVD